MTQFRTFEDLECWQACREVHVFTVRQVIPVLPKDEKYHLISAEIERLIDATMLAQGREKIETAIRLLNGYIHYLQTKAKSSNP